MTDSDGWQAAGGSGKADDSGLEPYGRLLPSLFANGMMIPGSLKIRADFPPGMSKRTVLALCLLLVALAYLLAGALPQHLAQRRAERRLKVLAGGLDVEATSGEWVYVHAWENRALVTVSGYLSPAKKAGFHKDIAAVKEDCPNLNFLVSLTSPQEGQDSTDKSGFIPAATRATRHRWKAKGAVPEPPQAGGIS